MLTGPPVENGWAKAPASETKVYKFRWYMVLVSFLLHVSQMFCFICYAPVANFTDQFYGGGTTSLLSVVFLAIPAVMVFFAMWYGRKFGLRPILLFGAWATAIGTGIRILSGIASLSQGPKRAILLTGQAIGSLANPFAMFLPTKVAAAWFPDSQRALCTSIIAVSSPLGILLINLIIPRIVADSDDIFKLNIVTFAPAAVTALLVTVGVCSSTPALPPSQSATEESFEFKDGLLRLATSRTFWVLFIALGGGLGLFNGLYTFMEQLMCPKGYSNTFAGNCIVLLIMGGLAGAILSGIAADKTKKFEQIAKISLSCAVISGIIFSLLQMQTGVNVKVPLAISSAVFGFFGMGFYAIGLELSAESTYPVAETTSAGLVGLSGQIQGILYIMLMRFLATPMDKDSFQYLHVQVCTDGADVQEVPKNMDNSMIAFGAIGTVLVFLFVLLFKPKYRRMQMEMEREKQNLQKENSNSCAR